MGRCRGNSTLTPGERPEFAETDQRPWPGLRYCTRATALSTSCRASDLAQRLLRGLKDRDDLLAVLGALGSLAGLQKLRRREALARPAIERNRAATAVTWRLAFPDGLGVTALERHRRRAGNRAVVDLEHYFDRCVSGSVSGTAVLRLCGLRSRGAAASQSGRNEESSEANNPRQLVNRTVNPPGPHVICLPSALIMPLSPLSPKGDGRSGRH